MEPVPLVRVVRAGLEESVHVGDAVAVDADGRILVGWGAPGRRLYARSCMKPLQAVVSMSLAGKDFDDREVAVMCASHNAEPVHLEAVRSLMARGEVGEDDLLCPEMRPWDDQTLEQQPERRRINSDCSGKHGGMLSACRTQGWPLASYVERAHPLQERVRATVLDQTGLEDVHVGVDGCGVPVHGLPLASMAKIYARLAAPDRWGDLAPFAARAGEAMRAEPYMVAGRGRTDTAVMEATGDLLVKGGAEGLMCAALMERGIGVAVKVRDGSARAAGPALIQALHLLDALTDEHLETLASFARPPVLGGGRPVGRLEPVFDA
jgi:L-asparaginase II